MYKGVYRVLEYTATNKNQANYDKYVTTKY